ncbi:MAG: aminodeoxychorismate lyase [Actinomycetales bacterium]|nr:MAG: aminodeoxychorismate lyase [Actinomycetales bacterium]
MSGRDRLGPGLPDSSEGGPDDGPGRPLVDGHDHREDHDDHDDHSDEPASSTAAARGPEDYPHTRREQRTRRRGRSLRRMLILSVVLGLVVWAGWVSFSTLAPLNSQETESSDFEGPGGEQVLFVVAPGDTGQAIGGKLAEAGIVKTSQAFVEAAMADPRSGGIQPGDYLLRDRMRAMDALAVLVDPANRKVDRVIIREGLWAEAVFTALSEATGHPVEAYEQAAADPSALGLPAEAAGDLEGYLFPATYDFTSQDSPAQQLRTLITKTKSELASRGLDPERARDTLIIASIIEAEVRLPQDRPKVARVIFNRLEGGMNLQMDSTVNFGVGKRSITTTDEERADDNPWNTYKYGGLPAGPVCSPGAASIEAALSPVDGPWLYFVAVNPDAGETKFAVTKAEHDVNVAEFRQWCELPENDGRC